MIDQLRQRLREENPETADSQEASELSAIFAMVERRRSDLGGEYSGEADTSASNRSRPFLVVIGAAALAIIIIASGAFLLGGSENAPTGTDSNPTTTLNRQEDESSRGSTTTVFEPNNPSPVDVTVPIITPIAWSIHPVSGAGSGDRFLAVASSDFGFLAGGVVNEPDRMDDFVPYTDAAVWLSKDGVTWERVGDPSVFAGDPTATGQWGHQWIFDIGAGPSGIVAVGTDGFDAATWYSDDGVTWERVRSDEFDGDGVQELSVVAALDSGFVAVGRNGSDTTVWRSPDGQTWSSLPEADNSSLRGVFIGVSEQETVWLTADGEGWIRRGPSDLPIDPESGQGPVGVVAWSDGLLAYGPASRVWTSSDGIAWTPTATDAFNAGSFNFHTPFAGTTDGTTIVIVGATVSWNPAIWTSTDQGDSWLTETIPEDGQNLGPLLDITYIGDRWIAIGETTPEATPYVMIGA